MKAKTGNCKDCAKDTYLTAGRCERCYWQHRRQENAHKAGNMRKQQQRMEHKVYFASQLLKMPTTCEECGAPLPGPSAPSWMKKAVIAHILPKRPDHGFPSVATHPVNKVFLCIDDHTNMDNLGDRFILKMKSLPVLKERVKQLLPLLTPDELRRVPEYLL